MFIILNNFELALNKLEELSDIVFVSHKNEELKSTILSLLSKNESNDEILKKIEINFKNVIKEIRENSNIKIIVDGKNDQELSDLVDELILDYKEQNNLKKIESLEKKLIKNMDESSYSEFIKLKNQLNRE